MFRNTDLYDARLMTAKRIVRASMSQAFPCSMGVKELLQLPRDRFGARLHQP